jgi:hypothetical protein
MSEPAGTAVTGPMAGRVALITGCGRGGASASESPGPWLAPAAPPVPAARV